jgi:hypothetical protein
VTEAEAEEMIFREGGRATGRGVGDGEAGRREEKAIDMAIMQRYAMKNAS